MWTWTSSSRWAVCVAAMIGAQNGVQIALTRALAAEVPPATLALGRYIVALALLAPLALMTARFRPRPIDLLAIGILGVLNFGVMIAVQNLALRYLPAARGALIFASFPFITLMLSATLGFERLTGAKMAGVSLTILGVALLLGERLLLGGSGGIGEALMLLSALLAAVCSTLYRPYVRRFPSLGVSVVAILCADLALLPLAWAETPGLALALLTSLQWSIIVTIGAMSALFYWAWLWALGRLAPAQVTIFHALAPVTAAISGSVFLDEAVGAGFLLGLLTVMAGFAVAYWPASHARRRSEAREGG